MRCSILVLAGFGVCWLALAVVSAADAKGKKHHTADANSPPPADKAGGEDNKDKPVPRVGDETSLAAIRARPESYVEDNSCIICGSVKISDRYGLHGRGVTVETLSGQVHYKEAEIDGDLRNGIEDLLKGYYCCEFREAGKKASDPLAEDVVHLYLGSEAVVDLITKFATEHPGKAALVRVKACLFRYSKRIGNTPPPLVVVVDRQWDVMYANDVQLCKPDFSGWQPWIIEREQAAEKAAAEKKAEAARRSAEERVKEESAKKAAAEAAKWRTWTDSSGERKIEAKYGGVIAGKVKLTKRDGSTVQVPLEKLSDEDQEWIKNRKR